MFAYKTLLAGSVYLFFTSANTLVTKALKETQIEQKPGEWHKFSHDILFVNIMVFAEGLLALWFVVVWFFFTDREERNWQEAAPAAADEGPQQRTFAELELTDLSACSDAEFSRRQPILRISGARAETIESSTWTSPEGQHEQHRVSVRYCPKTMW